jgi:hypothetical protein
VTQGHGAVIGTYVKLSIAMNRPGATCNDAVEADSRSKSSARPGQRLAKRRPHTSGADFPAFIVIDDKGNDLFKDLNLG